MELDPARCRPRGRRSCSRPRHRVTTPPAGIVCPGRRCEVATTPRPASWSRSDRTRHTDVDTRNERQSYSLPTRLSNSIRLRWHSAFLYGGNPGCMHIGPWHVGSHDLPRGTAQRVHVLIKSPKNRRFVYSPTFLPQLV